MKFLIVTGLSGAGKTSVLRHLEDLGFLCMDNLPPMLLNQAFLLCEKVEPDKPVALSVDTRSGAYGFRGLLWLCLGMAVLFTVSIGPFLAYSGYPGLSVLLLLCVPCLPGCLGSSGRFLVGPDQMLEPLYPHLDCGGQVVALRLIQSGRLPFLVPDHVEAGAAARPKGGGTAEQRGRLHLRGQHAQPLPRLPLGLEFIGHGHALRVVLPVKRVLALDHPCMPWLAQRPGCGDRKSVV